MENSTFLTQICLENDLGLEFSKNSFQNKNQYPRDFGLKFEKTNVGIRVNILMIHCVPIFSKNE